jgi:hypothetical protein
VLYLIIPVLISGHVTGRFKGWQAGIPIKKNTGRNQWQGGYAILVTKI